MVNCQQAQAFIQEILVLNTLGWGWRKSLFCLSEYYEPFLC